MDWLQFGATLVITTLQSTIKNPTALVKEIHILESLHQIVTSALSAAQAAKMAQQQGGTNVGTTPGGK